MEITLEQIPVEDLTALASGLAPVGVAGSALPEALPPPFVAERALTRMAEGKPAQWCSTFYIRDKQGRIVGGCGFKDIPNGGEVEIGYAVAPAARGRGIGTSAVRRLLDLAAQAPEVRNVVANINPGNLPSTRLVRSLGFTAAGEFTDSSGELLVKWCWSKAPHVQSR